MKIKFDIKNCYGIGALNHEIDYGDKNIAVVYAPNGTMKTSLTKTISKLLEGKEPCDDFYTDRERRWAYDTRLDKYHPRRADPPWRMRMADRPEEASAGGGEPKGGQPPEGDEPE